MVTVIYGNLADRFTQLKVAGDFSGWEIRPMVKNAGFWEYSFHKGSLSSEAKVIHFKFIDDQGVWFADDDYPKETDANNNENNVRILTKEELEELGEDDPFKDPSYDMADEGPVRPAPSPQINDTGNEAVGQQPEGEPKNPGQELDESTVIVDYSDAHGAEGRPGSSGTVYSQPPEVSDQYKTIMQRVIAFFTNLFRSWFSH